MQIPSVGNRRNAQQTLLAIALGDFYPQNGLSGIIAPFQYSHNPLSVLANIVLKCGVRHTTHTCGTLVLSYMDACPLNVDRVDYRSNHSSFFFPY